ncbi:MAG: sporulation transcriptional regulator SpoIIID [Clostridia bacterium]|nr:sporulation transcriptional regulator SpoIIID [Clostridia bacterium]
MIETADRARTLGMYITENRATVRAAAKAFGISKSTVHTDVTVKLRSLDGELWSEVREVLDENKAERHLRGGRATREKYLKKRSSGA